ncbi:MAG: hypothetical protein ACFB51_12995 [Anaerolineae bacterium]
MDKGRQVMVIADRIEPEAWIDRQAGQSAMLVRPTRTGGDVKLYSVTLDCDAWTRLLTGGLNQDIIRLP